jgi:hypothetical protein
LSTKVKKQNQPAKKDFVIIYTGQIDPVKDIDLLIDVIKELRKQLPKDRPETFIQMHTRLLETPARGKADPALLETLDQWTTHLISGEDDPGGPGDSRGPTEEDIRKIVCPAIKTFLGAIKHVKLSDGFSKSDITLLESAGNALVTLSEFFYRNRSYRKVVDSDSVLRVFEEIFSELNHSELDDLREMLTHNPYFGLPTLLIRFDNNSDVIYFPQADRYVFSGIVAKLENRRSKVVIGMHSMLLKRYFEHFHLDKNDSVSPIPFLDITKSYSEKTRRLLQRYVGLMGHLNFRYADLIIHYAAESQPWIEQNFRVPPEKSVRMTIGIPDRVSLRDLPRLAPLSLIRRIGIRNRG